MKQKGEALNHKNSCITIKNCLQMVSMMMICAANAQIIVRSGIFSLVVVYINTACRQGEDRLLICAQSYDLCTLKPIVNIHTLYFSTSF